MDRQSYIARGREKYRDLLKEPMIREIFPPIGEQNSSPEEPKKTLDSEGQNPSNLENHL